MQSSTKKSALIAEEIRAMEAKIQEFKAQLENVKVEEYQDALQGFIRQFGLDSIEGVERTTQILSAIQYGAANGAQARPVPPVQAEPMREPAKVSVPPRTYAPAPERSADRPAEPVDRPVRKPAAAPERPVERQAEQPAARPVEKVARRAAEEVKEAVETVADKAEDMAEAVKDVVTPDIAPETPSFDAFSFEDFAADLSDAAEPTNEDIADVADSSAAGQETPVDAKAPAEDDMWDIFGSMDEEQPAEEEKKEEEDYDIFGFDNAPKDNPFDIDAVMMVEEDEPALAAMKKKKAIVNAEMALLKAIEAGYQEGWLSDANVLDLFNAQSEDEDADKIKLAGLNIEKMESEFGVHAGSAAASAYEAFVEFPFAIKCRAAALAKNDLEATIGQ